MAHLELTDEEREALPNFLRRSIDADPFLLAPRLRPLKSVQPKLDPRPEAEVVPSVAGRYPVPTTKRKRRPSQ